MHGALLLLILAPSAVWGQPRARDLYFSPARASVPTAEAALGLRYSLLHLQPGGSWREVDTSTVFTSGDRIRLQVEANQPGFLYVLHQGSSQEWFVMEGSPIRVEAGQRSDVPPGGRFYFDHQPGEEKLFLVLSRARDVELDRMLGISPARSAGQRHPPRQAGARDARTRSPVQMAFLRTLETEVRSRNLAFEKVDQTSTPAQAEHAVYVVNTSLGAGARVVVQVSLQHR
jgi:hypothetical protein